MAPNSCPKCSDPRSPEACPFARSSPMRRTAAVFGLFAVVGLLAWTWAHAAPINDGKDKDKTEAGPKTKQDGPAAKLAERADFSGVDDPKATLAEVLEVLGKTRDVRLEINPK